MTALRGVLLAIAFLVELAGLAAFAIWGWGAGGSGGWRWILAIGAPVVAAVLWGVFCSPRAAITLPKAVVTILKLGFLAIAVIALIATRSPWWGVGLAVVALADSGLLTLTGDRAAE